MPNQIWLGIFYISVRHSLVKYYLLNGAQQGLKRKTRFSPFN